MEWRRPPACALPRALIAVAVCLCLLAPVSAVFLEVKEKGSIVSFNTENGTMTIAPDGVYECGYENDTRLCGWSPVSGKLVAGAVPDARIFSEFHVGDAVAATALGGEGGRWIAVGRIVESADVPYLTMIVGDPAKLPLSLAGDYALRYDTRPDCANCTGSVCPAKVANVTITSEGRTVLQQTLAPRETAFFNGRNDNSSVSVTFLGGQASAYDCSGGQIIPPGPQPVSSFVVVVNPPIGFPEPSTLPATTAPTTLALPALLPLVAVGLVGILVRRRLG
ncbi:hypothetical protein [Methanofollis sp.]|uniref:hypothetical protein n=1 Tax=Methanofollis sp. TaxID=2052835 RepID=UPI00261DCE20|nr:hypothetical protein [Methanofollis sp.]